MMIRPLFPLLGALAGYLIAQRGRTNPLIGALLGAVAGWLLALAMARLMLRGLNRQMRNINVAQAELIAEKICKLEKELQTTEQNTVRAVELVKDIDQWKQVLALSNYHFENCQATKLTTP